MLFRLILSAVVLATVSLVFGARNDEFYTEDKGKVRCDTTAGWFTVTLAYLPSESVGVERYLELVKNNHFDDMLLYRVIQGFLVQFGVAADPAVQAKFQNSRIPDEENKIPFEEGTLSFAGNGKDSRSSHLFVALKPNGVRLGKALHEATLGRLDTRGINTFIRVVDDHKDAGYADTGSLQSALVSQGNAAAEQYPKLHKIKQCTYLPPGADYEYNSEDL